jgi:hyperosmotically inducible protein
MSFLRTSLHLALGASVLAGVAAFSGGCEKKGPAEKAGEKVDDATKDAGHQINKAADKAGDAVEDATN